MEKFLAMVNKYTFRFSISISLLLICHILIKTSETISSAASSDLTIEYENLCSGSNISWYSFSYELMSSYKAIRFCSSSIAVLKGNRQQLGYAISILSQIN